MGVKGAARAAAAVRVLFSLIIATAANAALAYRPFDSTDADVVEPGKFELEFGPIGRLREGQKRFTVAPAVVANYGFSEHRELVLEGRRETALDREAGEPRNAITDTGLFIKQVLREGALQEKPGPSVATEYGFLLPTVNGEHGTGFSVAGIVSHRFEAGTIHLNSALAWTRSHEPDLLLGAIVEGPYTWTVRPVAEVFSEQASGSPRSDSMLLGAIWRMKEDLSLDFGVREARAGEVAIHELRAGLTWSFSTR